MSPSSNVEAGTAPDLGRLLARFLDSSNNARVGDQAEGEVELHEVAVGYRLDAAQAWHDTLAAIGESGPSRKMPTAFADAVLLLPRRHAQPMAAGHFPQLVADLQPFLNTPNLADLLSTPSPLASPPDHLVRGLTALAESEDLSERLIAAGLQRHLGLETAELPAELPRWLTDNERATATWLRGETKTAQAMWLQADPEPAVLFNRGMSALFTGAIPAALTALTAAVEALPEESGWHHLAAFYRAAAEMRTT